MLDEWRGEPGSPGLISRGLLVLLALFPPIALGNWAVALILGDGPEALGASIPLIAAVLVAASYPYWLPSIWRVNNRVRTSQIRARERHHDAIPHRALNARANDLPKRW